MTTDLDFLGATHDIPATNKAAGNRVSEKQMDGFRKYFSLEYIGIK